MNNKNLLIILTTQAYLFVTSLPTISALLFCCNCIKLLKYVTQLNYQTPTFRKALHCIMYKHAWWQFSGTEAMSRLGRQLDKSHMSLPARHCHWFWWVVSIQHKQSFPDVKNNSQQLHEKWVEGLSWQEGASNHQPNTSQWPPPCPYTSPERQSSVVSIPSIHNCPKKPILVIHVQEGVEPLWTMVGDWWVGHGGCIQTTCCDPAHN